MDNKKTGVIGVFSASVLEGEEHAEKKTKLTSNQQSQNSNRKGRPTVDKNSFQIHSSDRSIGDKKRNNKSRKGIHRNSGNEDVELSKSLSWVLRHTAPSLGLRPTSDGYIPVEDVLSLDHPRFRNGPTLNSRNVAAADDDDDDDGSIPGHTCRNRKYSVEDVIRVVENNDKQRFRLEYMDLTCKSSSNQQIEGNTNAPSTKLNETNNITQKGNLVLCIRANQGHSYKNIIESDKLLTPLTDDELSDPSLNIIHGTTRKAWEDHIRIEGLSRMKRNHIHFATGLPATCAVSSEDGTQQNCRERKKVAPKSGIKSSSQIYIYVNGRKCATDGIRFYRSDNGVILTAGTNDEGILPVKYFKKVVLASSGKILYDDD